MKKQIIHDIMTLLNIIFMNKIIAVLFFSLSLPFGIKCSLECDCTLCFKVNCNEKCYHFFDKYSLTKY